MPDRIELSGRLYRSSCRIDRVNNSIVEEISAWLGRLLDVVMLILDISEGCLDYPFAVFIGDLISTVYK